MSKPNGKPPSRMRASSVTMLALMLCAMSLTGCATRSTVTTTSTICKPWKSIRYASKTKTSPRFAAPQLVTDLRVHNATGLRLNCWK